MGEMSVNKALRNLTLRMVSCVFSRVKQKCCSGRSHTKMSLYFVVIVECLSTYATVCLVKKVYAIFLALKLKYVLEVGYCAESMLQTHILDLPCCPERVPQMFVWLANNNL